MSDVNKDVRTKRVVVVTAAGGGIGRAAVQHFVRGGATVVAVDRDAAALHHVARLDGDLRTIVGDLTDERDVVRIFAEVAEIGGLHVLVNGVGSTCSSSLDELTAQRWQQLFDLNLTSVFLATRAALPLMRQTSGDRAIINISSTLAVVADPDTLAYGAFKAGLEQMTRSFALQLAPYGIRAVAIAPGPVAATGGEAQWETASYEHLNPLKRFASTDEIGAVIAWLASLAAAYITGTTIRVDGGDAAWGAGWGPLRTLLDEQKRR